MNATEAARKIQEMATRGVPQICPICGQRVAQWGICPQCQVFGVKRPDLARKEH